MYSTVASSVEAEIFNIKIFCVKKIRIFVNSLQAVDQRDTGIVWFKLRGLSSYLYPTALFKIGRNLLQTNIVSGKVAETP